jgi:DNA-binding transcriptional LysR family regulator
MIMNRFDFNLLVTLDALLVEGSVRKAAERMNVTAPAMSHALSRLRAILGDPLFVRAGQRLVPTPRAIEIRERVRQLVQEGRSIFTARPQDEIKAARRTFTIRANGNAIAVLGATLIKEVQREAPGVQIRFSAEEDEGIGPLREGVIDLAIGVKANNGPEIRTQRLYDDDFVGVVRSRHPIAAGAMTLERYAAADHVVASRRGRSFGPVDILLQEADLSRGVPVIVPDMLAAVAVAAGSDYVATVPRSVGLWAQRMMKVVVVSLPFATDPITVFQSWHPRLDLDSAHCWLRNRVSKCACDFAI